MPVPEWKPAGEGWWPPAAWVATGGGWEGGS